MTLQNTTNAEYHADRKYLSSSAIKMLYKDPTEYYDKYVLGNWPKQNSAALDFGTAAHLAILEPHLFDQQVAVYTGGTRRGKAWDEFKASTDKLILTLPEKEKLDILMGAYNNCTAAKNLIEGCQFEHTMTASMDDIPVKCRHDAINVSKGYIVDVKTTGYAGDIETFRDTVNELCYDLSGYMYSTIAQLNHGIPFDFYLIVLSKTDLNCMVYRMSRYTFTSGAQKFKSGIETYKKCLLTNNWQRDILSVEVQDGIQDI